MTVDENGNSIANEQDDGLDLEGDEILKLLNGDPKNSEEDDDDEFGDELDPQDGDSPEVLKTKLAAKNKIIRHREKAIKRMQKELEAKQGGGLTAEDLAKVLQSQNQEPPKEEGVTLEQLKEQFDDDPSTVIDLIFQQNQVLEQKLANVLKQRDEFLTKKLLPNGGEPAAEVKELVERLRQMPKYEGFSDEQLITVAEMLKPLKKRIGKVPTAVFSGRLPMNASVAEVEKVSADALAAMGYTD